MKETFLFHIHISFVPWSLSLNRFADFWNTRPARCKRTMNMPQVVIDFILPLVLGRGNKHTNTDEISSFLVCIKYMSEQLTSVWRFWKGNFPGICYDCEWIFQLTLYFIYLFWIPSNYFAGCQKTADEGKLTSSVCKDSKPHYRTLSFFLESTTSKQLKAGSKEVLLHLPSYFRLSRLEKEQLFLCCISWWTHEAFSCSDSGWTPIEVIYLLSCLFIEFLWLSMLSNATLNSLQEMQRVFVFPKICIFAYSDIWHLWSEYPVSNLLCKASLSSLSPDAFPSLLLAVQGAIYSEIWNAGCFFIVL